MDLAKEVIGLKAGSERLELVRKSALEGLPEALKQYVYYCILEQIRSDKNIPIKKKLALFRDLVKQDVIEVTLG